MYKTLRENTALAVFAVITVIQTVFAVLWTAVNASAFFSFAFVCKLLLLCASSTFAAFSFEITPLFALFTVTSPFMLLTISSSTGASDNGRAFLLIASIAFLGLLHLLWKNKKKALFFAVLILGVAGFVLSEKFFVFEWGSASSVKMSFSYLLFEKTFWPHFEEYQYILPDVTGYGLTNADINSVNLRNELAGELAAAFGDGAKSNFLRAAVFAVSVGTKTFVKETVIRLLLYILAPFGLLVAGIFKIPDTFAAENLLELAGRSPLISKWYLVFFYLGLMAVIAGALVRAIAEKNLKESGLSLFKHLCVLFAAGLFVYFFRLPCFDIRDAGTCGFLFTLFWVMSFLRSKGRCQI